MWSQRPTIGHSLPTRPEKGNSDMHTSHATDVKIHALVGHILKQFAIVLVNLFGNEQLASTSTALVLEITKNTRKC